MTPEAVQRQAVSRLLDYYLHTADLADRVLTRSVLVGVPRRLLRCLVERPALGTQEDAAAWLEIGVAKHPAGRALRGQARVEAPTSSTCWLTSWRSGRTGTRRPPPMPLPCKPAGISLIRWIARAALALSAVRQQTGQHEAAIPLAEEAQAITWSLADRSGEAEGPGPDGPGSTSASRFPASACYFEREDCRCTARSSARAAWPIP